ncbi:MAG TPA: AAA family ATPase [Candidatus Aquicultor sp.]|jgi:putative ATP-dependent endonuclease of OLD family
MKLKYVNIANFRSIKDIRFEFPQSGILILVGANNAGKSNIIRAINNVLGSDWFSSEKLEDHDFYNRCKTNEIKISLTFDTGAVAGFKWWTNQGDYKGFKRLGVGQDTFMSNEFKEKCPCTYLGADRSFDRHTSFYDWTLIGKIRKAFHNRAAPLQSQLQEKYNELASVFDQVDGFTDFKDDFARYFQEMQADTPARLSIDFKPFTPSNYFKTMHILATDPNQSDEPLDLSELGEGSRNMVLLALLRSYTVNFRNTPDEISGILALEEPEIYLHPQARRHLYKILRDIANNGIQVIISTHSSSFVDTEFFDSIGQVIKVQDDEEPNKMHTSLVLVSKSMLVAQCRNTGVPANKVCEANITEFYKTTSNHRLNESFFAKFLILVEGETEELTLPELLVAECIDCDLQGISIIAVKGKNQIPKYWRLFSQYKTPIMVVFDNDDDGTDANGQMRAKRKSNLNLQSCFGLELDEIIENIDIYKTISCRSEPNTPLLILENDFETALRKDFTRTFPGETALLDDWEAQAKDLIKPVGNQNKGQIARFIARKMHETHPAYCPSFVREIASIVKTQLFMDTETESEPDIEEVPF